MVTSKSIANNRAYFANKITHEFSFTSQYLTLYKVILQSHIAMDVLQCQDYDERI